MTGNYHTHTYRCGHADGIDEDYVKEALGMGLSELGFSDHVMYPGFNEPGIRGPYNQAQGYFDSIRSLAKKYEGRIKIYLGYEAEAFDYYMPYLKVLLQTGTLDYLLLGNHGAMNSLRQVYAHFGKGTTANTLYIYKEVACKALRSGLYSCFVHPDLFLSEVETFDSDCRKISTEIIETAMECDVPLEINVGGIRSGKKKIGEEYRWSYPTTSFFSIASEMGAKCIIGIDAHSPKQLSDEAANSKATLFAQQLGLWVINRLEMKKVR